MFKVSKKADPKTFWATVTGFQPPAKPGGSKTRFTFDAQFQHIDSKEDDANASDWEWFVGRVIGWKGVTDDDGDLEFCEENLRLIFDLEYPRLPIIQAYYGAINGTELRRKN